MTVTSEDVLDAFREADDPVLTTPEVSDVTPGRRVSSRLEELAESGILARKTVGDGETVWWLPGHTETSANTDPGVHDGDQQNAEDGLPRPVETAIQGLDLPDEDTEACRTDVYAACLSVYRDGPVSTDDLRGELDEPARWEECVHSALEELPFVHRDGGSWRFEAETAADWSNGEPDEGSA
ncbi:hypothetical protein DMJ13_06785 [halophilic archaeon]|nr:hypothetical protein DMJ13_06785 [halophilic archaeon]